MAISKTVQEINGILEPDRVAGEIAKKYTTWRSDRSVWEDDAKELRNYIFQTDTTQTSNSKLPWKNKTSVPKLCQLRDNLHANYFAALFPNDNWFKWEGATEDALSREKARVIEAYIRQKVRESNLKEAVQQALYDYIDYGNCFGEVTFETQTFTPDKGTGERRVRYSGPVVHRVSPLDHYFDISASSYKDAAKITRRLTSMGSLKAAFDMNPSEFAWVEEALASTRTCRADLSGYRDQDIDKSEGTRIDGFGNLYSYYSSDMIELLEYEGDFYNAETDELYTNYRFIVMDRRKLVHKEPCKSWLGRSNKEHVSWRPRPDNLMGMGPLDNLVGMQYRLDHLENLKADVFDQIAHPIVYTRGLVEDWEWGPGEKIFGDIDSHLEVLRPDPTALNADFQMDRLMRDMEELAGAPRQAMGIRTPGEKTAFEVQALENAAGRIFQQKIQRFEEQFLEPLLDQFLEAARRNLHAPEMVKVFNEDEVVTEFLKITPDDINAKGKIYPVGARHYAKQNQLVQNLTGLINSGAYQDPAVSAHISGERIAKLFEEFLGLEDYELVEPNIRVIEQGETQKIANQVQEAAVEEIAERESADDALAATGEQVL